MWCIMYGVYCIELVCCITIMSLWWHGSRIQINGHLIDTYNLIMFQIDKLSTLNRRPSHPLSAIHPAVHTQPSTEQSAVNTAVHQQLFTQPPASSHINNRPLQAVPSLSRSASHHLSAAHRAIHFQPFTKSSTQLSSVHSQSVTKSNPHSNNSQPSAKHSRI